MLQALREKAQGWIAWVIVILIALTFILFWGSGSFLSSDAQSSNNSVATVNGEKITLKELESQYEKALNQQDQNLSKLDPVLVKKQLLDNLIEEKLLIQTSSKLGFRVNPSRIDLIIGQSPLFQQNGQFSAEVYRRFLYSMNLTDKAFKGLLAGQLLQQQLYSGLAHTSFVVEPEIDSFVKFYTQKRSFKYTIIQRKDFIDIASVSDDEIKKYYDENTAQFYTPEKISVEFVRLNADELKSKFQPDENQLRAYHKENSMLFNDPERRLPAHIMIQIPRNAEAELESKAKEKIQEIQTKLKAGESFESLASQYSDDTQTKQEGGKLDWIVKGELGLPELEQATFALKKGEVSEALRTDYGIHIVKLLDVEAEKIHAFDTVKDKVLAAVKDRWAEDEIVTLADQLANMAYDHPDSLLPIADKLGLSVNRTELFDRATGPADQSLNEQAFIEAAFSDYVKNDGNNSDLIKLSDKGYVVLRVLESVAAAPKELSSVSDDIKSMLIYEKSNAKTMAQAESLLNAIRSADQTELLTKYQWTEKSAITRNDTSVDRFLLTTVFDLPRSADNKPVAELAQLENSDYAVVWLTEVAEGSKSELTDVDTLQVHDHLVRQMGELEFYLFSKELNHSAKIKNTFTN